MTDIPQLIFPNVLQAQQSQVVSNVVYASQISLGMTLAEIILTVGANKQVVDPATGQPGTTAALEWLMSISFPPTTATSLLKGLKVVIEEYEKQYGKIPADPKITAKILRSDTKEPKNVKNKTNSKADV